MGCVKKIWIPASVHYLIFAFRRVTALDWIPELYIENVGKGARGLGVTLAT